MATTIDAHQHFWRLGQFDDRWLQADKLKPIRHDFLPQHLLPGLNAAGIQRSIIVQTQHQLAENSWALRLAQQYPFIAGIVGWVDLRSPECEEQVIHLRDHREFVGVRHVTHDEPDDDFLVRDDVLRGLKVLEKHRLPFDLLLFVKHLKHATTLARQFPTLPLVIDHAAKPRIAAHSVDDWLEPFRAAARCENVYCKLSGLVTEADWRAWQPADLKPYVQEALDAFGPERLMFGSDWPVCLLAGNYVRVVEALKEALGPISPAEREQIFGGTAARFYKLAL